MKNFVDGKKIGIFYDGNYWTTVSNYYNFIHPLKSRLNVSGLHSLMVHEVSKYLNIEKEECYISDAHFFKNRYCALEARERGNQLYYDRVVDDILMYEGVTSHYIPIRGIHIKNSEKEMAVCVASTITEVSILRELDVVIIVASDMCYIPLFRKLRELGKKVVLVSWNFDNKPEEHSYRIGYTSNELIKEASLYMQMEKIIDEGLEADDETVKKVLISRSSNNQDDESIDIYDSEDNSENRDINSDNEDDEDVRLLERGEILVLKSGYGFVKYPNNNLFFHYLDVIGNFTDLKEGDKVQFTIGKNKEGNDVAKNVKVIEDGEEDDDFFNF